MVKDLGSFLRTIEENYPHDLVRIEREVDPAGFEVTAVLQHLENIEKYPMVLFEKPKNIKRNFGPKLITNVFATRKRCALAVDFPPEEWRMHLSLEFARRERMPVKPIVIDRSEAPIKEVVDKGEKADLSVLPLVKHHRMDAGPYLTMAPIEKDPDSGAYDISFAKNMYKGPRESTIYVVRTLHLGEIAAKYEKRGLNTPVAVILGHHPAFYLGALALTPFGNNDYETVGGFLDEPLRLVESETWGKDFLVPADAEVIVEGEIPPNRYDVADPFGDIEGYYYPQQLHRVLSVTAVTYRRDAIYQDVFSGHREHQILGGIPKEGSLYNYLRLTNPRVKAVHFPHSGCCRFTVFISMEKVVEGESKLLGLAALGRGTPHTKLVVVVDDDVDVFNEREVWWAVATRVQADRAIEIVRDALTAPTDPSITHSTKGSKWLIDATKPADRPYEERISVPKEALDKVRLEEYIPPELRSVLLERPKGMGELIR